MRFFRASAEIAANRVPSGYISVAKDQTVLLISFDLKSVSFRMASAEIEFSSG